MTRRTRHDDCRNRQAMDRTLREESRRMRVAMKNQGLRLALAPFLAPGVVVEETDLGAGHGLVLRSDAGVLCLDAVGDDMTYLSIAVDDKQIV